MQRLNDLDLSGYLLDLGGWEHLKIECEYEERRVYTFPRSRRLIVREADHSLRHEADGQTITRIEDGGLLWPAREGPNEIAERKLNLGSMGFASQYQQRPAPLAGALFKRAWLRYWKVLPPMDRTSTQGSGRPGQTHARYCGHPPWWKRGWSGCRICQSLRGWLI